MATGVELTVSVSAAHGQPGQYNIKASGVCLLNKQGDLGLTDSSWNNCSVGKRFKIKLDSTELGSDGPAYFRKGSVEGLPANNSVCLYVSATPNPDARCLPVVNYSKSGDPAVATFAFDGLQLSENLRYAVKFKVGATDVVFDPKVIHTASLSVAFEAVIAVVVVALASLIGFKVFKSRPQRPPA